VTKALLQILQTKFFCWSWKAMWASRWLLDWNPFPHRSHVALYCPKWPSIWRFIAVLLWKEHAQSSKGQAYARPWCLIAVCFLSSAWSRNVREHEGQGTRWPSWIVRLWRTRVSFLAKHFPHESQQKLGSCLGGLFSTIPSAATSFSPRSVSQTLVLEKDTIELAKSSVLQILV
jgi:hypothetical protein